MKVNKACTDIGDVIKYVLKRIWIVLLSAVTASALFVSLTLFLLPPSYTSDMSFYVDNRSAGEGENVANISLSDVSAAQTLVKTCGEILMSRTSLEEIAIVSESEFSYSKLSRLIEYEDVNGTGIIKIKVTSSDPESSANVSNAVMNTLPNRVSAILEGVTLKTVDRPSGIPEKESLSVSKTVMTAFLGAALSSITLAGVCIYRSKD